MGSKIKKSLVRWMAKNDPEAYGFWKDDLMPDLGRNIKKTEEAIRFLKICARSPYSAFDLKHGVVKKIARKMEKYQNSIGASITFGYLLNLAQDHKRKILRQRNGRLSK